MSDLKAYLLSESTSRALTKLKTRSGIQVNRPSHETILEALVRNADGFDDAVIRKIILDHQRACLEQEVA